MNNQKPSLRILRKAVGFRHRNQECALKLLEAHENYPQIFKRRSNSLLFQKLTSVSFSLWRAAFLADKNIEHEVSLKSAVDFLTEVVCTNNIAFSHDYRMRDWTFNYYVWNARLTLQQLHGDHKAIVPRCDRGFKRPIDRWEYAQELLEKAVDKLHQALRTKSL